MPLICERLRIAYFPVPKVACTSAKFAMHRLIAGRPFRRARHGGRHIQAVHPTTPVDDATFDRLRGYWTFAILRDPLRRLVSAYADKADRLAALAERRGAAGALPVRPSLEDFALHLAEYRRRFHLVRHHTDPFSVFLGPSLDRFDALYRLEEIPRLERDLSTRAGEEIRLPHRNASPEPPPLSPAARAALLRHARPDYALLGAFYPPPPDAA